MSLSQKQTGWKPWTFLLLKPRLYKTALQDRYWANPSETDGQVTKLCFQTTLSCLSSMVGSEDPREDGAEGALGPQSPTWIGLSCLGDDPWRFLLSLDLCTVFLLSPWWWASCWKKKGHTLPIILANKWFGRWPLVVRRLFPSSWL